tara:strand:+ start:499 stop:741 length:243 start_codon:yes stop_codon:yes gene_type:complete
MKRGDLVMLSAYGKQVKRASWIEHDDVGIITRVIMYKIGVGVDGTEYEVHWIKSRNKVRRWQHNRLNHRSDLKYAKSKPR